MAMLNSLTLLGGELVGRSYGGGILKLEPKEADRLPVPSPETLSEVGPALRALRPQLARHLRNGELGEVIKQVDRVVLTSHLKVKREELTALRTARQVMFSRRTARTGRATGEQG